MGEVCVKKDGKGGRQKNKFRHGFFALLKGTPRITRIYILIFQLSQVAFLCCLCHSEDDRTKNLNTSAQLALLTFTDPSLRSG